MQDSLAGCRRKKDQIVVMNYMGRKKGSLAGPELPLQVLRKDGVLLHTDAAWRHKKSYEPPVVHFMSPPSPRDRCVHYSVPIVVTILRVFLSSNCGQTFCFY